MARGLQSQADRAGDQLMGNLDWDLVYSNIATLAATDIELTNAHIVIAKVQPNFEQDCVLPQAFPSRAPSVNVTEVKRFTFAGAPNYFRGTAAYDLAFVYLHIMIGPLDEFMPNQYEQAIRQNVAKIFRFLIRNARNLGVNYLMPMSASIDEDLQGQKGRYYMGSRFSVACSEIVEF